jgi:hypothetical protein
VVEWERRKGRRKASDRGKRLLKEKAFVRRPAERLNAAATEGRNIKGKKEAREKSKLLRCD